MWCCNSQNSVCRRKTNRLKRDSVWILYAQTSIQTIHTSSKCTPHRWTCLWVFCSLLSIIFILFFLRSSLSFLIVNFSIMLRFILRFFIFFVRNRIKHHCTASNAFKRHHRLQCERISIMFVHPKVCWRHPILVVNFQTHIPIQPTNESNGTKHQWPGKHILNNTHQQINTNKVRNETRRIKYQF